MNDHELVIARIPGFEKGSDAIVVTPSTGTVKLRGPAALAMQVTLRDYLRELTKDGLAAWAAELNTSAGYLRKVAYGGGVFSLPMARRIAESEPRLRNWLFG